MKNFLITFLISLEIVLIFCDAEITFSFSLAINLKPSLTFCKKFKPSDSILSGTKFFLRKILSLGEISRKIVRSGCSPWQAIDSIFLLFLDLYFCHSLDKQELMQKIYHSIPSLVFLMREK